VVIIPRYVSDVDNKQYSTLDRLLGGERVNFIKMDVEGFEEKVAKGAENLLSSNKDLTVVACAYHTQQSERNLRDILAREGFSTLTSNGYMIFIFDKELSPPYLRRGLVVGRK
jgi:predicted GNAT superfamily acetyltransferase